MSKVLKCRSLHAVAHFISPKWFTAVISWILCRISIYEFIYLTIYCSSPKRVKFKYKNINFCPAAKEAETIHGTQSSGKHQQKALIKLFFNYFAGPQSQNNEAHKKWTPLNSACKSFINNFFCSGSCCGENPVIIDVLIASLTTRNPVINSIRSERCKNRCYRREKEILFNLRTKTL